MAPEQTVGTETLAKYLLLTSQRVRDLVKEGVLERAKAKDGTPLLGRFHLRASVNAYIGFLRSRTSPDDPQETDYQRNRALRMHALAQTEQLRLRRIRGEMHHSRNVEFLMTTMLTALKSRLLALPSRVAPYLLGKTNTVEVVETIRIEVYSALEELSEYDPAQFAVATEEYLASIGRG